MTGCRGGKELMQLHPATELTLDSGPFSVPSVFSCLEYAVQTDEEAPTTIYCDRDGIPSKVLCLALNCIHHT